MKNIIYGKISIEIVSLLGLALVIILMTSTVSAERTEPLIIDHNCTNLSEIPDEWIDQAKTDLHIAYQHTSHGSQLITGMNALESFPSFGTKYEWSDDGSSGLDLDDYGIPGCADLSQGDWIDENGVAPWVTATRNLLNNTDNYHVNVVIWSWCSINGHNITRYLENMEILVSEYSVGGSNPRAADHPVEFVFMTGHAEGQGEGGFIHTANEQIRQHCLDNDRILFDFADIENYDPDGTYYYDNPMWDDLDYNPGHTNNWGIEWCAANVGTELEQLTTGNGVDGYSGCGSCAHCGGAGEGNTINCVLKGRGCWWMFASLAGWNLGDGTIYVPDDYLTIQDAVDNATAGDTIIVRDGTYNENVDVDKSLNIQSENGSASTFVQAAHSGDHVFHVTADYVNISGFTLTGTTVSCKAGVHLYYADYCNISDNNASDNYCGIYLEYSNYNTFMNNTLSNNVKYGIYIYWNSNYNTIRDVSITTYEGQGGLYVYSIAGQSAYNDIDTSNTINGKPIQFFDGFYKVCSDDQVLYYNDTYSLVHLYDCDNITLYATSMEDSVFLWSITNSHIYNVDASHGWDGVVMRESDSNTFTNITTSYNSATGFYTRYCDYNNFINMTSCYNGDSGVDLYNGYHNNLEDITSCNNDRGFYVRYGDYNIFDNVTASDNVAEGIEFDFDCDYNTINNSYIENNGNKGLYFYGNSGLAPDYNLIYNNYFDNGNNAYDEFGGNTWNISKTSGTNIIDGGWLGGNYWSDYTGEDTDDDRLGNTKLPYNCSGNIQNGGDWLPLTDVVYVDDDFNETTPGWQIDHFDTIQDGIDAVEKNGIVYVFNGTYIENVAVYKSLKLIGDGVDNVTVEADDPGNHVFDVTADYVKINGFTVTGTTGDKKAGVSLSISNHCNISDVNASGNDRGITLSFSSCCIFMNNTIMNNTRGIYLYSSSDNTLTNNIMVGNTYNFGVNGDEVYQYVQNIDTSNTVDGKPIYYWVGQQDAQIPSDAGCVGLVTCKNITVKDITLINNTHSLLLADTNDSVIENVTALGNYFGIYLKFSDNNTLINNNASNNYCGIYLDNSSNTLTNNAALNNSDFGIYLFHSNGNNLTGNAGNGNGWYGIELYESSYNLLVGNTANSNGVGSGFVLYYSSNNTFVDNTANLNAFSAIGSPNVGGFLLYLSCDHNVFVNNTANSNGGYGGFVVWSSSYNNLTGNNVSFNDISYGGIFMYSSSDHNNLSGNAVNSNNDHGIYLWLSNYNTLAGNTVNSNDMNGIYMYSSNNNVLADNDVLDNSNYGFSLYYSDSNELTDNNASDNYRGFNLYSSDSNELTDNYASNNSVDGIYLSSSNNVNVTDNDIIGNSNMGIYVYSGNNYNLTNNNVISNNNYGVSIWYSNDNIIENNTIVDNNYQGVNVQYSNNNNLTDNNISDNNGNGLYLQNSNSNNLKGNIMSGNVYNFGIIGNSLPNFVHDIDTSNTVDGKPIYYWVGQQDAQIPGDAGYVGVVNSNNITVRDLTLAGNHEGVLFANTSDSTIENITALDNWHGVYLYSSSNNTLLQNNVSSNEYYGIDFSYSNHNLLMNNNVIDNDKGVYLSYSDSNNLSGNNASSNDNLGFSIWYSNDNMVMNNTLTDNGLYGAYLYQSSNNNLTDNIAVSNDNYGMYLQYSSDNVFVGNNASDNSVGGIRLTSSSNNNDISGNTVNSNTQHGIYIYSSSDNNVTDNIAILNNNYGIYLYYGSSNIVTDNYVSNNGNGIHLYSTSNNVIVGNNASNCTDGIYLDISSSNTLIDNIANSNLGYGIYMDGPCNNNLLTDNTANSNNNYGIRLYDACDYNVLIGNTANSNNLCGFSLSSSSNNRLENNSASDSNNGIGLYDSSDYNNLTNNTLNSNGYGIYLTSSNSNNIYNNYFDNGINAYDDGVNIWNISKTSGTNIFGGDWLGGNYWSDYIGADNDGDGLGNTELPYNSSGNIQNGGDMLPLTDRTSVVYVDDDFDGTTPGWQYDYFDTIQDGIDGVVENGTVYVFNGIYTENVAVNKSLTLIGDGIDNVTVEANDSDYHVFDVTADYVDISGFTVTGATTPYNAGIYLYYVDHCNIFDNNVSNNHYGIKLDHSNYGALSNNTALNTSCGINLLYSSDNSLINNIASSSDFGIVLYSSSSNNLTSNTANLNAHYGIQVQFSSNDNTVKNNIANLNDYYGIYISGSSNNIVNDNNFSDNECLGILLSSSNNTISGNIAHSNKDYGIYLSSSFDNIVNDNNFSNSTIGIRLDSSSNNLIYNNYFNNTDNVFAYDYGNNIWNTSKTPGTNIIGGDWLGGNYWSDYTGVDTDGDGLGNTSLPYNCSGNILNGGDWLPLVEPSEPNDPPAVYNENPANNTVDVDITLSTVNVTITDADGDPIDWTIETSPDIGSNSANGDSGGNKTCSVSGLSYDTTYTWFVNVTDGTIWTNETYSFTTESEPSGWYTGWLHRKEITIDHSQVAEDLSDFPILIHRDSDSDLVSHAQSSGDDIVFTDQSGVKLSHEIELYDGATGELDAWVKVPSLSSTTDTVLYMYYGNLSCGSQEDVENVWDDDYMMVQHLDETSGTHYDSTSNDNDGSPVNSVDQSASGMVNGADDFDGIDSYVHVSDANSLDLTAEGMLEAWIKMDSVKNYAGVVHKGDSSGWSDEAYSLQFWTGGKACLYLIGSGSHRLDTVGTLSTDVWYHVVGTWNASGMYIYVNGALDNSKAGMYSATSTSGGVNIGAQLTEYYSSTWKNFPFDGVIDEVRISSSDRGDGWIETSYNTAASPDTFVSIGSEQTQGNTVPYVSDEVPSDGATGVELIPVLKVKVDDADGDTLTAYWYSNSGGSWSLFGTNSSIDISGGFVEISQVNSDFDSYSTTYYWSVNVTDGTGWTNETYSFTTESEPAGWYPGWSYRKEITIDHFLVAEDLFDFPVLVHLDSDSDLAPHAQSNGNDILFTDISGAKLSHEVELYNGTTGELDAWVSIPSLSSTTDTVLYMYYGNATCGSQEDVENVWDGDFVMVQHLDETSGDHYDSTSYDNDGSPVNSVDQSAPGKVDGADDFDGVDSYVHASDASSLDLTAEGTLEAWFKMDSVKVYGGIIHKGDSADWSDEAYALQFWNNGKVCLYLVDSGSNRVESTGTFSTDVWYHVVGTWNASGMYIYVNGALDNSKAGMYSARSTSSGLNIGAQLTEYYSSTRKNFPFDGVIDEVRISSSDRSDGWIETSYNTAASPDTFLSVGGEENLPPS